MKVLNKVSLKNLKLNKKRTASTIIGIILSVALVCAVAAMANSFQATLVKNAVNETGYYHVKLMEIKKDDLDNIKNDRDIKDIKVMYDNGYAYFNSNNQEDNPYIHIYSTDQMQPNDLAYYLIEGRFAKDNTEIVINKSAQFDSEYQIGDEITLEVGTRKTTDNYELNQNNPVQGSEEKLVNTRKKTYKIVGIVNKMGTSYEYYGITAKDTYGSIDAYISLKEPKDYKQTVPKMVGSSDEQIGSIKDNKEAKYNYALNNELLKWEVFAVSDTNISMLYAVVEVVLVIILITSVFCIRNSFAISTLEKTKMYGMLASVGATKKQIKKSVLFEGACLGFVGIPLGILSGIFAVWVLIQIINALIGKFLLAKVDGIAFTITLLPIIVSIVLGAITIYLSAISSARKASKVSPIEQLRNSSDIKIKAKKLKTPKIIEKLFKTGGVLAYKNLKRSKKKYKTTVISLAVSIFVFITMNSFITNTFNFADNYYATYDYNINVEHGNIKDFTEQDIQKIRQINGVEQMYLLYENDERSHLKITDKSKINEIEELELLEESYVDEKTGKVVFTGQKYCLMEVRALDDASFRAYAKKIGANYEKVKTLGILCDDYQYETENSTKTKEVRRYTYQENDTITGQLEENTIHIKVGKITDIRPFGMERHYYSGGYLIVNEKEHPNLNMKLSKISLQVPKEVDSVVKAISDLQPSVNIINLEEAVKQQNSIVMVINIFLYGFIAVITLIGVTNIFNTITSNMELRQKEFAMLKSIGMTKKEFNRMINLETIFYGTKALLYGIILGLIGNFAIDRAFRIRIDGSMYLPIKPILLSIIFVFIIMKYSISKINKQNTIETIRKENI